mgnify:FL=1
MTDSMVVLKKWKFPDKNEPDDWFSTSLDECISNTENSGYWVPGSVKPLLLSGEIVFTPCAYYKLLILDINDQESIIRMLHD